MKKQSRTVPRRRQSESPAPRHLPLVEILIDTEAELQELVVASGLKVLEAMLEEDRAAVCGTPVCTSIGAAGLSRRACPQSGCAGRPEGRDPATARPPRRHGGAAAHGAGVHGP